MALGLTLKGVSKAFQLISKQYADKSDVTKVRAYLDHVKDIRSKFNLQGNQTQQPGYLSPLYDDPKTIALRRLVHEVPVKSSEMAKTLGFANQASLAKKLVSGDVAIKQRGYLNFVKTSGTRKGAKGKFDQLSTTPLKTRNDNMIEVYEELAGGDLNLKQTLKTLNLDGKSLTINDAAKILGIAPNQLNNTSKGLFKKGGNIITKGPDGAYRVNLFNLTKEAKKVVKTKQTQGAVGATPDYIKTTFRTEWDKAFKKDFPDMAKEAEDFRKSMISGTAGADGSKVADHIRGVANSLNDKDMGLIAFNKYVQSVMKGRHMNSLSREQTKKLTQEFIDTQRKKPEYMELPNILGRENIQQMAFEMNTPGIIRGSKGSYFDKIYDNVFEDAKYLTRISDESNNIKSFFIKGTDQIDDTVFNLDNLKDLQKLTVGSAANNYRGFNTSMFNNAADLNDKLLRGKFIQNAKARIENIDGQISKRSQKVVDKYLEMAALRESEGFLTPALPQGIKNILGDAGIKNVFGDGGRVKKFMGGYINPEDIEAEIEMAEQTDGEILSQKEAIERIVERFTNNFKEGGLAREKFQVGGSVGGGIGGGISGGISGGVGNSKVGNIQAVLAGIAAGVIDIPKGAFSLGASLMDLGLGTSTAAKVENFFDNLTTFDEIAEQRTAGQIARIITNLGIPGSQAWKVGTGLAKKAMFSRNAGKYFTASDPKIGPKIDDALKANGRLYATLGGAAGIGVADAIFVGDPERVGTLGDAFDFGPTQLRPNNENDAAREVMNRLKFGLDSSLLLGLVGGSGSAIKSMIKRRNELESNNDFIDKILSKIRPRGDKPEQFFKLERESIGIRAEDVNRASEISRGVDRHIDGMFPFLKPMYEKSTIKSRSELMKSLNDALLSGTPEFAAGGRFSYGKMDDALVKIAGKKMKDLGAKPEAMKGVFNLFDEIRGEWGEMFSALGRRMSKGEYADFSAAFGKKLSDYLGTTYDVFRNKSLLPFLNFKAGEESIDKLANMFIKTAKEKGEDLTKEQARHYVDNILTDVRPGGRGLPIKPDATAGVYFKGNKFFDDLVDKSILGDIEFDPNYIKLNTLRSGVIDPKTGKKIPGSQGPKEVIDELLGKIEDPIQTILAGTQKLSLITRRNEFFDKLLKESNLAKEIDPKTGAKVYPNKKEMFFETEADAFAAFGKNNKQINFDPNKNLEAGVTNPLNGLYAQTGVANALEETSKSILDRLGTGSFAQAYQNFILYPKATSQLAKTVLSPITHVRNLFSASAFAAANGLLPGFIAPDEIIKNMKSAYGKLQFGKAADPVANKEYRKLLRLGVVNSNVTLGDLSRLLEDVKFGENITASSGVKGLMRQFSKLKRGATDLYTAEDDLWKIYTFATERGRFEKAFQRAGITKSADELDEIAADIVRNNVPNYDYVSDFVKGLRQFPIGNFVSFPAEIMRTSVNIMTRGLKEYNESQIVNGVKVYPLRNIGLQRLFGFAATTTAIPYALVEGAKALYDVSGLEMDSLRRFVPEWSKNSTLIPVRGDDGELKYVDFSHANAYDTMIRPVTTLINNIRDGQTEGEAVSKSILQGVFEATKELGQPFISEAIWTEAATDIIVRGGRTRDGRRLYTEQTPNGEKAMAIVGHLVDSQLPGSIEQFKRFDLAIEPVDIFQSGKFDKYGKQYELSDELLGIVGLRAVKVDPVNSMKFKIADFTRGVSNSRREFTSQLLRGGPVTPEQIVDRYQIANNQLYKVQQELFRDYYAARTLGAKESALDLEFADRVSRISLSAIKNGRFKPFVPSENIIASFGENARNIGQRNPYLAAKPVIDRITRQFNNLPLVLENFPILPNPFSITQPTLPTSGINTNLPNLNLGLSMPTGTGTTGNTIQKGQTVFGPLDPVFGS